MQDNKTSNTDKEKPCKLFTCKKHWCMLEKPQDLEQTLLIAYVKHYTPTIAVVVVIVA